MADSSVFIGSIWVNFLVYLGYFVVNRWRSLALGFHDSLCLPTLLVVVTFRGSAGAGVVERKVPDISVLSYIRILHATLLLHRHQVSENIRLYIGYDFTYGLFTLHCSFAGIMYLKIFSDISAMILQTDSSPCIAPLLASGI
jgi:hypothetical protein